MRRAARLGATAVVFHAGSSLTAQYRARALRQVRHATARLLAEAPTGVDLLVEPTAGGGAALASTILWDEAPIGANALSTLVRMRGLADVPLLVETPTHPEDVALLKQWRCGPTKPDQTA
jgi:endonuclease IV